MHFNLSKHRFHCQLLVEHLDRVYAFEGPRISSCGALVIEATLYHGIVKVCLDMLSTEVGCMACAWDCLSEDCKHAHLGCQAIA